MNTDFKDALDDFRNSRPENWDFKTYNRIVKALCISHALANPTEGMKQYADFMLGTGCNGITVFHGVIEHMISEIDNADGDGV